MEQKRHDDLACDEEPWYLSGSDPSDAEDQSSSSNASSSSATSPAGPRLRRRWTSASSLPCCENLLASDNGNKSDLDTVRVMFTMSKLRPLCL